MTTLTAAQQQRQDTRDGDGRYSEMQHLDPGDLDLAGPGEPEFGTRFDIPAWGVAEADARIAKANRRLERAGIDARFEATYSEPFLCKERGEGGREQSVEYVTLTLNHPQISYDGWEFAAALDDVGDGQMVVRSAPGVELDGWRPEAQRCDHCGVTRQRSSTYLVRHEDGRTMQVGSSCMSDFLGVKPAGLWSIGYNPFDGMVDDDGQWSGGGGSSRDMLEDTRMVVAAALVVTNMGKEYKPASFDEPTSEQVRNALWGHGGKDEERKWRAEVQRAAEKLVDSGEVDEVLAAVAQMRGGTDYADNMKVLTGGEVVRYRHAGLVASSVAVWNKDRERKVADARPKAAGWIAEPGAKINTLSLTADGSKGVDVTVEKVFERESYFGYTPKTETLLIMRTADGHTVKWNASGAFDVEIGTRLRLTGGSVKGNDTYQGTDQTVVTRVKFDVLDGEAG